MRSNFVCEWELGVLVVILFVDFWAGAAAALGNTTRRSMYDEIVSFHSKGLMAE